MSDRIEVVSGGVPTDEELAAIVIALTPVASGDTGQPAGPPAWHQAAIIEGLGGRPVTTARDLDGRGPLELL